MHNIFVREWMTSQPIVASPTTTLPEALELMQVNNIRRLPVVANDLLVGIVTKGDLRGAQPSEATSLSIFELNYLVSRVTVGAIMTRQPVCVTPSTTVLEAAKIMLQRKISGLPVMEDGRLVGVITESDIFRMVVRTWPELQPEAEPGLQSA